MKKAIVMAGVLFALTMTAGCGSQNQDHAATAESDVTENEEEVLQDKEGLQTMRTLGRNIAFMAKSIALGKEQFGLPEKEQITFTNFHH